MTGFAQQFELAVKHHHAGNLPQAEDICRQILQQHPGHVDAWHLLGLIAGNSGRHDLACEYLGQAVLLNPDYAEAHFNLGTALLSRGKPDEAVVSIQQSLRLKPANAQAYYNLGTIFLDQDRLDEAVANYREAVRLAPDFVQAHNNLGIALRMQGNLKEAVDCIQRALHLNPAYAEAYINLGTCFQDQGNLELASASYQQALRLNSNLPAAHNNLGLVCQLQGKLEAALDHFQQALRLKPDYVVAHFSRAMLWLRQGDFVQGWPEYEWRRRKKDFHPRSFPQPDWDGGPLNGKAILLHHERGLGDSLQFVRYAALVKQQGGRVLLQVPAELLRIFRTCAGIDQLLTLDDPLPDFDVQIPLMSVPALLRTTLANVPASIPYLCADSVLALQWRQEIARLLFNAQPTTAHPASADTIEPTSSGAVGGGLKIGIVWQGEPRFFQPLQQEADRRRSIPLAYFIPLARLPGVRLFSLQKGYGSEQLAGLEVATRCIIDLGPRLHDFADTAAVMMNMDLIISADTSPAHLAGALGRPVWTVLPAAGCWRWLEDREDSPWYPTMRLFRQRKMGDWAEVFERIAAQISLAS